MNRTMKKLLAGALVAALILSLMVSVFFVDSDFAYVADSIYTSDYLYAIDDNGEDIVIAKMDHDGKCLDTIKTSKMKGDSFSSFDYLTTDGEDVYVYELKRQITTNEVISETVYTCDFTLGRLKEAWVLPSADKDDQSNFAVQVRDGVLTWFTAGYNAELSSTEAVVYSMAKNATEAEPLSVVEFDAGIGFSDFFLSDDGTVVFTTPEGNIYFADTGRGEWRKQLPSSGNSMPDYGMDLGDEIFIPEEVAEEQLKDPDTGEVNLINGAEEYLEACMFPDAYADVSQSKIVNFTSDGKHTIYFIDLATNDLKSIDVSTGEMSVVMDSLTLTCGTENVSECNLKNLRFYDDSLFTGTVTLIQDKGMLGISRNGTLKIIKGTAGRLHGLVTVLKWFTIIFVLIIILMLLGYGVLRITKGRFPVAAKVVAVCIPVVIASVLILQAAMSSLFVQQITDQQYKELYLVAKQQMENISGDLLDDIDYDRPYDSVTFYNLRSLLTALPENLEIWQTGKDEGTEVHNFGYFWLYRYTSTQQLLSAYCDQNYIDVPIEYYYGSNTGEVFRKAAADNRVYRTSYRDTGGEWICLAVPVADDYGNVVAVLETGTSKASLDYAVAQNSRKVGMINLAILLILVILLTVLLLVTLHPLKQLRQAIQAITEGDLGVQTTVRGNDEIADVSRVFNQMSSSVEYSMSEMTRLNEGCFRFVPSKMFQLLRKSSVTDVRLGDQTKSDITILSFNATGFQDMISSMNSVEMFGFINDVYSELVPVVNSKGGVVDRFEEAGLVAFFTGSSEDAVSTAVSVCQEMDVVNKRRMANGLPPVNMTGGISYGPVMVGIVGHAERLSATTVSEHTNLSGYLQEIGPKYSARVLTTAATIERIADFDVRYNARFIGFLHVTATDKAEKLYDVFDGDSDEIRQLKAQTKELFERGVELYCRKEYYEARLVFIEVLKRFRMDAAAKEYLYRCDSYYQMDDTSDIDVYIEEY